MQPPATALFLIAIMSLLSTSTRVPTFEIGVIAPTTAGARDQPRDDGSPLTFFRSDQQEGVMRLLDDILSNPALADRVRSLDIMFDLYPPWAIEYGLKLQEALPVLPKLESLSLAFCLEFEYGLLNTPVCFPRLKSLHCDFRVSARLERFLLENPTITDLSYGGADMQDYDPQARLPYQALPNLTTLECDIWLLSYFLPGRPVSRVVPLNYGYHFSSDLDFEIQAMKHSTADNGIAEGGGVKSFTLGAPCYPLQRLVDAVPNLEKLELEEGHPTWYDAEHVAERRFWTAPDWERDLALLEQLRDITVNSQEEIVHGEQCALVRRWLSSSVRPKALTMIKFTHWRPCSHQVYHVIETATEFRDRGSLDAGLIPELVDGDSDPDTPSETDLDETASSGSSNDVLDAASSGLDHQDIERGITPDSSDSGASSTNGQTTRWWWNQVAGEWYCAVTN